MTDLFPFTACRVSGSDAFAQTGASFDLFALLTAGAVFLYRLTFDDAGFMFGFDGLGSCP